MGDAMKRAYYGHDSQIMGVEEHRLIGGRGDGMRILEVRNGNGLEFTVSLDRCADISRLSFFGYNFGFMSVNGYVDPAYYDDKGTGWLKSFTAGFLTTCGLENIGPACTDCGERLPLHGHISNTPAERVLWDYDEKEIWIKAYVPQACIFGRKLMLERRITCRRDENRMELSDTIRNYGCAPSPVTLLYHINIGYPLLEENAELYIPSESVSARDDRAADGLKMWNRVGPPEAGFTEQCYFHDFGPAPGRAGIFNPDIQKGLMVQYDTAKLTHFTQRKMMGVNDYALGLEPSNCSLLGRDAARRRDELTVLEPGESVTYCVGITMADGESAWRALKQELDSGTWHPA